MGILRQFGKRAGVFVALAFLVGNLELPAKGILPTKLNVTVYDRMGNLVENAEVVLYGQKEDYISSRQGSLLTTGKKGQVTFKKLEPKPYYVEVRKGMLNNHGMGAQTDTLSEGRVNAVVIIIE